jgi:hypothetical protein
VVGPGDVLVLILIGEVELAYTLQVTREGFILIPQVGQVFASHLTLDQLREVLYSSWAGCIPACGAARTPPHGSTSRWLECGRIKCT